MTWQSCTPSFSTNTAVQRYVASVYQSWALGRYYEFKIRLVVSKNQAFNSYSLFLRWRLLYLGVLRGHINFRGYWPSLQMISLRPQRTIPITSETVRACQDSDLNLLRGLFNTQQAHPDDCTDNGSGNLTLLRVGPVVMARSLCANITSLQYMLEIWTSFVFCWKRELILTSHLG